MLRTFAIFNLALRLVCAAAIAQARYLPRWPKTTPVLPWRLQPCGQLLPNYSSTCKHAGVARGIRAIPCQYYEYAVGGNIPECLPMLDGALQYCAGVFWQMKRDSGHSALGNWTRTGTRRLQAVDLSAEAEARMWPQQKLWCDA